MSVKQFIAASTVILGTTAGTYYTYRQFYGGKQKEENHTWAGHTPDDAVVSRVSQDVWRVASSIYGIPKLRTSAILKMPGNKLFV